MARGGKQQKKKVEEVDFGVITWEARKQVWSGAVPLQLHLHPSEVSGSSPPSPFLVSHLRFRVFLVSDLL